MRETLAAARQLILLVGSDEARPPCQLREVLTSPAALLSLRLAASGTRTAASPSPYGSPDPA